MRQLTRFIFLLTGIMAGTVAMAQDTLPRFSVKNAGKNRIVVSWTNPYADIRQLSIQRSYDSVKGYKTILTMADPTTPQNGFVDNKAPNERMFYRLYIMLEGGRYLFSTARRPVVDSLSSAMGAISPGLLKNISADSLQRLMKNNSSLVDSLLKADSITRVSPFAIRLKNFQTGDSINAPNAVTLKERTPAYVPSLYVYTNKDGYVKVSLPEAGNKKYNIRFYEEDDTFLFELKDLKVKTFKIDKANFFHAGWFRFELIEDGKILEKHKFFLESDF
ncbi:MAG: hypothetical protein J0M10_12150 [Chitinophagales bacterium]|nr:hypothetical protein [Chitinophagales bacterium]